ncbi:MAG: glycosyl transferase [Massilia sp.]|jgi:glycosyltransferase involved in cell wall biosynthesis|nr:glycosyl transferase [Massilia sp.]
MSARFHFRLSEPLPNAAGLGGRRAFQSHGTHPIFRVAHLTSVHRRNDTRIFIKQCRSLAAHGYNVTLVVADGQGADHKDGVAIIDVGCVPGRLNRMLVTARRVFNQAVALDADIYHLHDPELIPVGLKLKRLGKTVIFDSHEATHLQLLAKSYLGPVSRQMLSLAFSLFERYACSKFDGIVTATPFIRDMFLKINPFTVDVNNFPLSGELDGDTPWTAKRDQVCYVGGISGIRGIRQLVQAGASLQSPTRLALAGRFSEPAVEAEVKAQSGWSRVDDLGFLDRAGVRDVLARSVAGMVTLLPAPNHLDSHPIKMFEYMSSGIPVIASNFPLWREIVEGNECGVCVDPLDPKAIAAAIDNMVRHPGIARSMGENGRKAVLEKYNWDTQAARLTDFYGALAHGKQAVTTI